VGRIERTWHLTKGSWAILRQDKELAWIPVISAVVTLAVAAAFLAPFLLVSDNTASNGEGFEPGAMGWVLLVLGYVVTTFVATYFNGALVSGALERMRGGDPSLGSALRGATGHFHRLAPWALLAATVGLILQMIENIRVVGPIIRGLLGLAWNLITFLTIPILLVEDLGPFASLKRSASLFRQTWGENVTVQFGFSLVGLVAMLPGILIGGALIATGNDALVVLGIAVMVASIVLVSVVISALSGIFRTALYLYAAEGTVIPEYGTEGLSTAFRPR
jgi:Family of unknown function (DUF6159)